VQEDLEQVAAGDAHPEAKINALKRLSCCTGVVEGGPAARCEVAESAPALLRLLAEESRTLSTADTPLPHDNTQATKHPNNLKPQVSTAQE
jgi:hypothetical protein